LFELSQCIHCFSFLFVLFFVGHKFRCPCNLAGFCKGDLTGKAEIPLPNSPCSAKKNLFAASMPDDHKSARVSRGLDLIMRGVHCMMPPASPQQQVTQLLCQWREGDPNALEKLIPLVQPELVRLAHHYMSRERPGHTLQTTALLDDAYLRLADKTHPQWQNRAHFFAVAAQIMRRIMVDHARQRHALKRSGGAIRVTLDECAAVTQTRAAELLALDEALEKTCGV
jgi:RNA polymerase sigma factor (TIGR02999 family)